ncbi:hypothetical protein F0562_034241 [Nyssa sinensis]|uniref:Adenylosuccinate synthetase n=1 Tax=Nyssa sinensis TaxID=561372 RepID=A0A5J5AHG4_9ASTE|nr:hypothetical protein F0562_034241 [Nyssa sinensis]
MSSCSCFSCSGLRMSINRLLRSSPDDERRIRIGSLRQVSGVLGSQWGDEGKGKLVDILAKDVGSQWGDEESLISWPSTWVLGGHDEDGTGQNFDNDDGDELLIHADIRINWCCCCR